MAIMKKEPTTENLVLDNIHVRVEDKPIVRGLSLTIRPGEVHALMGPNGTGKSSLSLALMGHPRYQEVEGSARLGETELFGLSPDQRSRAGLFLAMQYPAEIPGVPVSDFIRSARQELGLDSMSGIKFGKWLQSEMEQLGLDPSFAGRYLNEGFSGGEKKRAEVVQMRMLKPKFAILDEIDSGLDIDALVAVAHGIREMVDAGMGVLVITHYSRLLYHLTPDMVHVMCGGEIVRSAPGMELADSLEAGGYEAVVGREVTV
jgi:Fe-S cluster assembly ATP-binding protein